MAERIDEAKPIRVGITQGDMNGIGFEVILKTLADARVYEDQAVVLYASPKVAAYHKKALDLNTVNIVTVASAQDAMVGRIVLVNCVDDDVKVELGQSTEMAGRAAFQSLDKAVSDLKAGLIDVLVTAPINKQNIQSEHFHFPGHTEFLEKAGGDGRSALMIMASEQLRIAVATGHVPLQRVSESLDVAGLVKIIRNFNQALQVDFGIRKPRLAVLGLNPHAGDHGVIGTEDDDVVAVAIKKAQDNNVCCFGPMSADGFFGSGDYKRFDAVLAMYHDQGLIPFKTLCMDRGVNVTAGLPFVRTSPAHGTAYALAGKNEASEASFREAYYMACDIFRNRQLHLQLSKNPLRRQNVIQSGELDELTVDVE
ncbi:MAG: 4-hydroxythreonine-4-phosphate dehydrogenase PdxA [Bacteroidales bacterium]|nr:4-hydroxythreonine-4-phosphate dehydrogenase PdxA [Bacteroidales bacterium]